MTDDSDETMWPPALWGKQLQEMGEEAAETQMQLVRQMMNASGSSGTGANPFTQLGSMGMGAAMFKTRVQSGGRISIPDAERETLGIDEGDIVQTVVIPMKTTSDSNE